MNAELAPGQNGERTMTRTPSRESATPRAAARRAPRSRLAQAVSMAVFAGAASSPLHAQQLEEVVVTATKRSESVLDVPIAMTAMSGNEIRQVNLNDIKDLISFTPGISGNTKDSFLDFVSVRGIRTIDFGNGGDPSIALYKNGLYQGRNGSAVSSLYDVERSEVLRGPQGFLFARNAVSGAINVITAKASTEATEGYVEADVGERGVLVLEGAVNVPVSDSFAIRIAGFHTEEDGYVSNLAGGPDLITHDNDSLRLSARWETDKLTADLILEYDDRNQSGTVYRATGEGDAFLINQTRINGGEIIPLPSDGRAVSNDNSLLPRDDSEIFSVSLLIDYDLGWATLSSITGYKDHEYAYVEDYDGLPTFTFNYGQEQEGEYFEQELRLTSNSDGPLDWYAGASLYREDIDTTFLGQQEEDAYCLGYFFNTCSDLFDYYNYLDSYYGTDYYSGLLDYYFGSTEWTPSPTGAINDRNRIVGKYQGYSAYLDIGYAINEQFDVNVGIRYSYDEKEFSQEVLADPSLLRYKAQTGFSTPDGALRDKRDWSETTYRLIANWRPTDDALLFGSITTGYKPGGFGSFNIEGPGADGCPFGLCVGLPGRDRPGDFGPETVTSYEIGYKGTLMDGRTQVSLTGFYYQYEDLQAIFSEGPRQVVDNVGKIDGWGTEAEIYTALTDNVTLRVGGSWFDSEANGVQAFCGAGEVLDAVRGVDACEGNSIPWAPEFTAFAVLNASFPLDNGAEVFGLLAWSWEDDYRGDWPDESLIFQEIQALDQTDIQVGYRTDNWSILGYVENVFDNIWYDGAYADDPTESNIYPQHTFGPSRPRTAGIRASYSF
jgi:iron complex outermembrane receptor protein